MNLIGVLHALTQKFTSVSRRRFRHMMMQERAQYRIHESFQSDGSVLPSPIARVEAYGKQLHAG